MVGSDSREASPAKSRISVAGQVAAHLLAGLALWLSVGWAIDYYLAATAEDRYQLALRQGDLASACLNAAVAAEAYDMARDRSAYRKWQGLKAHVCRQ